MILNIQKKYSDSLYEYRHVILPKEVAKRLADPPKLLTESEWRGLGVQQSLGWVHYEIHKPEPHILLFRRPLGTDPRTGQSENTTNTNSNSNSNSSSNVNGNVLQEQKQPQASSQSQSSQAVAAAAAAGGPQKRNSKSNK